MEIWNKETKRPTVVPGSTWSWWQHEQVAVALFLCILCLGIPEKYVQLSIYCLQFCLCCQNKVCFCCQMMFFSSLWGAINLQN